MALAAHCQTFYAAFGQGNIQYIIDGCAENVRWLPSGVPQTPMNRLFEGKSGAKQFFEQVGKHNKWTRFVPERFIEGTDGATVVVLGSARGTIFHHPEATWWFTHVWTFGADRKVVEMQDQWRVANEDSEKVYGVSKQLPGKHNIKHHLDNTLTPSG